MPKNGFLLLLTGGIILGCHPSSNKTGLDWQARPAVSVPNILADLEFLTADALEGREATKRGEKVAALFLSSELQKYGVSPLPGASGYMQKIDLRLVRFSKISQLNLVGSAGAGTSVFKYGDDFTGANRYYPALDTTAGLVFAGYGITAPEYNYDDYARIGADGKIVIVFYGEPDRGDSTYFAGEKESRYSFLGHKLSNAREHGALGVIFLSQFEKTYGWEKVRAFVDKGNLQLKDERGEGDRRSQNESLAMVTISEKSLPELFNAEKYTADSLLIMLARHEALPAFLLKKHVRILWKFESDTIMQAQNVVGIIPGSEKELRNEYVGIGAHYDHVGAAGDTVFKGADDNASGTAAILEAARALALEHKNKRPILVIFHTAEEKGLLGSRYMSQQPEIADKMMAYINLDMVGGGSADTLYSVGANRISPELLQIIEEVNDATVRFKFNYELNKPDDPERIYYRSDHYNYARKGIPVVFFFDYFMKYYHTPADDLDKLNIDKIIRVSELTYRLALELANHREQLKKNQ